MDIGLIDIEEMFEIGQCLDTTSSFGNVFTAVNKKTGEKVVAKILKNEHDFETKTEIQKLYMREVTILGRTKFPAVVGFRGFSFLDFNGEFHPTLFLEYAPNKSLGDLIKRNCRSIDPIPFTNTMKMIILYGIAQGMKYLASLDIVHRDLKPDNVLLNSLNQPLITDFGHSRFVEKDSDVAQTQGRGTILFNAPETIEINPKYSEKSDVFSYGMILYWIFTKKRPYNNLRRRQDVEKAIREGNNPQIPNDITIHKDFLKLMEICWRGDPERRPTFAEIVEMFDNGLTLDDVDKVEFTKYQNVFKRFQIQQQNVDQDDLAPKGDEVYIEPPPKQHYPVHDFRQYVIDADVLQENRNPQPNSDYVLGEINNNFSFLRVMFKTFRLDDEENDITFTHCLRLVSILPVINYPTIIKYYGFTPPDDSNREIKILFDGVTNRSTVHTLHDELYGENKDSTYFNHTRKSIFIFGIAAGMAYLHRQGILHRSLTTKNILLDELIYPMIAGLYNIRFAGSPYKDDIQSDCIYLRHVYENNPNYVYNEKDDVFAFGFILYELINENTNEDMIIRELTSGKLPSIPAEYASTGLGKLIRECWDKYPSNRPTFDDIVERMTDRKEVNDRTYVLPNTEMREYNNYQQYLTKELDKSNE